MPRGGRRHGKSAEQHRREGTFRPDRHGRDKAPARKPTRPPRPPEGLPDVERDAWLELAGQVARARTYDATRYSAFRLMVKSLALVNAAPLDLKPTSMRGLIESASKMLARFGLDPVGVLQADVPAAPDEGNEVADFLFGRKQ